MRAKIKDTKDMKMIDAETQKKLLAGMLEFLDDICRKNNIKYSLYGGTLIGAIRHKGFIPWDDDIDVVLTKDNYDILKRVLSEQIGRYRMLEYGKGGEKFSFIKLIDTYTQICGDDQWSFDSDYGIFIDIFCYYPTSMDIKERRRQYNKIKMLVSLNIRRRLEFREVSLRKNTIRLGKNILSALLGYKRIRRMFEKTLNKYSGKKTDYVVSNWPVYGFEKEIQLRKNTEEYIDAEFEGLKVMIFKNYDEILRTIYGNYMQLPPESERIPRHSMKMWWKKGHEDGLEKIERANKKQGRIK